MRKRRLAAALGAVLAALTLMNPPLAAADPPANPTTGRLLVGVGSRTTQFVMNDFANGRTGTPAIAANPRLGSWNTLPLDEIITTKAAIAGTTDCGFPRPFGSQDGVSRLIVELNQANAEGRRRSCVDFARSSSGPSGPGTALHWVPFGVDGLTYATRNDSGLPSTLTQLQLQAVYLCNVPGFRPLLPSFQSGTRSAWLTFIGVTEAQVIERIAPAGGPIEDGNGDARIQRCLSERIPETSVNIAGNLPLPPNVGRRLIGGSQILPYSIAQLRAQQSGAITNDSGLVQGRRIGGIIPDIDDTAFPFRRLVYNVVPTQFVANADYVASFGPSSSLCTNPAVLRVNGFAPISSGEPLLAATGSSGCGDLTTAALRARTTNGPVGTPAP